MLQCPTCGREISRNARECPGCGEPDAGKKAQEYFDQVVWPEHLRRERESRERQEASDKVKAMEKKWFTWPGVIVGGVLGLYWADSPRADIYQRIWIVIICSFGGVVVSAIVYFFVGEWFEKAILEKHRRRGDGEPPRLR
jgi:uncharacterized membrane protein YvbJ